MEICGFPDLDQHRAGHRRLTAEAAEMADTWRRQRDPETLDRLRMFLRNWLFDHFVNADGDLAAFAKGRGLEIRRALEHIT